MVVKTHRESFLIKNSKKIITYTDNFRQLTRCHFKDISNFSRYLQHPLQLEKLLNSVFRKLKKKYYEHFCKVLIKNDPICDEWFI